MGRLKIDYGIDLGTTNSAICRMEKGVPTIKKIEVTDDTMPSCVYFNKKQSIIVGSSAYRNMKSDKKRATKAWTSQNSNTYIEFKRTMGTDTKYHSSNMGRDFSSEELSAEVLKSLKSYITDETIKAAVITVPAKFSANQTAATSKAAKLAGFDQCELLQEPIAAAMAYGLTANQKNGYWMVFDFGGGTFDAALLKVEDGIIQVFDTEGDNYLGGKNLDYALVDEILIPYIVKNYSLDNYLSDPMKKVVLRDALKTYAEELKNELSFKPQVDILSDLGEFGEDEDGEEIELDLTVTQEDAYKVMQPIFQKAVDICLSLIKRNNLQSKDLDKVILVGGPTNSPLIRTMLKEQITPNVDCSIDPMTAVATGAALYSSTINLTTEIKNSEQDSNVVRFDVGYESTSVEEIEWVSLKLDQSNIPSRYEKVWVELTRSDLAWSSGKVEVNAIGNVVEVNLISGKVNSFIIAAFDEKGNNLECFPNEISIIQGSKVGSAPLPFNIGFAVYNTLKKKIVFESLLGLEKNKPIPATGVTRASQTTQVEIRPGVPSDILKIPVYQADSGAEGKLASLYEYIGDVIVTGDDVEALIPKDSCVDITLKVKSVDSMTMELYFPTQDITVSKTLDVTKVQSIEEATARIPKEIAAAQRQINSLKDAGIDVTEIQSQLDTVEKENTNSPEKKAVLQHLKEVLRNLEDVDSSTEWERLEKDLRNMFEALEKANEDLGNKESTEKVNYLRIQVDNVIRTKNIDLGNSVLDDVRHLFVQLTLIYLLIGFVEEHDERFYTYNWTDSNRARQLLNKAKEEINGAPTVERLHPIVKALISLLPREDAMEALNLLKGSRTKI